MRVQKILTAGKQDAAIRNKQFGECLHLSFRWLYPTGCGFRQLGVFKHTAPFCPLEQFLNFQIMQPRIIYSWQTPAFFRVPEA